MLQAILLVLKILLWIVLIVLGILLVLILLVLFAPIKYKVDAKYKGTAKVMARINFLILSVRVNFDQELKKLDYVIRIAGIKLNLEGKNKQPKKKKKSSNKAQPEPVTDGTDISGETNTSDEANMSGESDISGETNIPKETNISDVSDNADFIDEYEEFDLWDNDIEKDVPKEQLSVWGRIKAFVTGISNKIKGIKRSVENFEPEAITSKLEAKLNKVKKTVDRFKKFWNLKCTVKTRRYLKKYLIGLIKHIGPRKIKGYVRYGFGDPCKTGQVTGYLSLLPFVYSKDFSLQPDFYNKVIEGDVLLKGRIRLGYIIRIVLNINIWRTIIVAKKIFKGRK